MKIALAQIEIIPNRPDKNIKKIVEYIARAKKENVDLIAFPEMALAGYLLGDKWLDDDFCRDLMGYNKKIIEASKGIAVAWGNIYLDEKISENRYSPNKDGRIRRYNTVYICQDGKYISQNNDFDFLPEGIYIKTLLPNYRFFDDERYFFSMQDISIDFSIPLERLLTPFILDFQGEKISIGFELCEDLWCKDYRRDGKALNVTSMLIKNGADYIINLSSSPWTHGKNDARDRRVKFLKDESKENFRPLFYVNNVGAQNNGKNIITFDGGSTVYNSNGEPIIFDKKAYNEELIFITKEDLKLTPKKRKTEYAIKEKHQAILTGLRHIKNMTGLDRCKFIIGLSGGVDSSLVCSLLVEAYGKENVTGINMPSKYNSKATISSAEYLAEALNIKLLNIPIENLTKTNSDLIKDVLKQDDLQISQLTMENIQAKIRGTSILSNLAGAYNAFFTNNGNKLEIALGYATLYGDIGGVIAPIGDLTKVEVFEMCRYINKINEKEIIPEKLLPEKNYLFGKDKIAPTAELKENQKDPMKFGYHDALIETMTSFLKITPETILEWYLNKSIIKNLNIDKEVFDYYNLWEPEIFIEDLKWFISKIQTNVFKRVQAPPIIITSRSAYGFDIRESQLPIHTSKKFKELENKILQLEKSNG